MLVAANVLALAEGGDLESQNCHAKQLQFINKRCR
jgi:hypothetical protein